MKYHSISIFNKRKKTGNNFVKTRVQKMQTGDLAEKVIKDHECFLITTTTTTTTTITTTRTTVLGQWYVCTLQAASWVKCPLSRQWMAT